MPKKFFRDLFTSIYRFFPVILNYCLKVIGVIIRYRGITVNNDLSCCWVKRAYQVVDGANYFNAEYESSAVKRSHRKISRGIEKNGF